MLPVEQPFKTYTDLDGDPLHNGFVYFGLPEQAPIEHPVTVFWDAAGTIPAAQPLRTVNGYIMRDGTPANVFYDGAYSMLVQDSKARQVSYAANSTSFSIAGAASAMLSFTQNGSGAVVRTLTARALETVSVRDFITTSIDGVTSNQAGIVAAVAYAYANELELDWPAGTYISTGNIPSFHEVVHSGRGVIKREGATYFITPRRDSHTNTLNVATSGNDANDGLTAGLPFRTTQRACDVLQGDNALAKLVQGSWKVYVAAGTYAEGATWTKAASAANYVEFYGDVDGSGTPTTIIDGTSSTKTASLYFDSGPSRIMVRNMRARNFRANSVASGFVFANKGIAKVYTMNVWSDNNRWSGVNADCIGQLLVQGGTHDGNTNYNLRVRGGVEISIGYNGHIAGNRVTLKNCSTASQVRDASTGHFDYFDVINCAQGIWVTNCSRVTTTGATFTTVNVAYRCGGGSVFDYDGTTTFTSVNNRYLNEGGTSDNGDGFGEGLHYDAFNNRWMIGQSQWGGSAFSSTAHAWATSKTTNAAFSYLVPDATVAQMIWGSKTIPTAMRLDAVIASNQFKFVANNVVVMAADASSVNPWRDNAASCGSAVARWAQVYAATATISTSDERAKADIAPVSDAVLRAWGRVNFCQYRFRDAIEAKGDAARVHFGVVAQQVKAAFEAEGLDAFAYGLLCYDEWDAMPEVMGLDGVTVEQAARPAGSRYGIRYEEALVLECAYLRSKIAA